ncbi:MAG: ATP-grasp domain-containing protein [Bacteroidetes bacterium]|nr:MAG: ATP-grasp domain-containing protein [Bacteroidota bacterium]
MFLIDKPYVSDFLIKTLKDNDFKVVATKEAKELIDDDSLNWISEETAIGIIENDPTTPVNTNSENAIAWILKHLGSSGLSKQIQLFKDKVKFRELMSDVFPDYFYTTVALDDIQELNLDGIDFPFVIKPSLGFFSVGVHIVRNMAEWDAAKKELNADALQSAYPKEVLDTTIFIIEEYIEGEEYAVDCYFDKDGHVVIFNILHHIFSSGTDISDRVYSTSKDIIQTYKNDIEKFLKSMGEKAELKSFAAHVEIRIDAQGRIRPIEVNPARFGGWCTTGDLTWYAYGINSYTYFINQQKPDWAEIFKSKDNKIYSIVVLNNNSGIPASEITHFDYELLAQDFENALVIRKLDINKTPVFGFVFTETSPDNEQELNHILVSDLKKYIGVK